MVRAARQGALSGSVPGCRERLDQLRDDPEHLGPDDRIGVVARVDNVTVADRHDEAEWLVEGFSGRLQRSPETVLDDHHVGIGGLVDDHIMGRVVAALAGTLYRHFPTKEALFEAVVDDRLRQLCHEAGALETSTDPGAGLHSFLDRLVGEASPKQDLVDALARADMDVGVTLAETGANLQRAVGQLPRRVQDTGAVRPDVTLVDLMALVSGLLVVLRHRVGAGADPNRAPAVLWDGLTHPTPEGA